MKGWSTLLDPDDPADLALWTEVRTTILAAAAALIERAYESPTDLGPCQNPRWAKKGPQDVCECLRCAIEACEDAIDWMDGSGHTSRHNGRLPAKHLPWPRVLEVERVTAVWGHPICLRVRGRVRREEEPSHGGL